MFGNLVGIHVQHPTGRVMRDQFLFQTKLRLDREAAIIGQVVQLRDPPTDQPGGDFGGAVIRSIVDIDQWNAFVNIFFNKNR